MPNPIEPVAYNIKTAAEATGMSEHLVYRAVKSGDLKAKRTSQAPDGQPTGKILILRKDLEEFLENLPDDWWGYRDW